MKFLGMILFVVLTSCISTPKLTDSWVRDRVFQLVSHEGSCTAFQVRAPSKKVYMMTARHCRILEENGHFQAIDENGTKSIVQVVAIAEDADVMLLTAANSKAFELAKSIRAHQDIFLMTHGGGFPSYKSFGEVLKVVSVDVQEMTLSVLITTAHVVPGSSGGPALSMDGKVLGVVSISADDVYSGLVKLSDMEAILKGR